MSFSITDLHVRIGNAPILTDIHVPSIAGGEIVAIVGANGAGKSSLIRAICSLLPFTGDVQLQGLQLSKRTRKAFSAQIGYVPQRQATNGRLSVGEMLILAQKTTSTAWRVSGHEIDMMHDMLRQLEIAHLEQRYCAELSGGQAQLVYLAQAMITQPKLLLLDEPTSALDLSNQIESLDIVRGFTKQHQPVTLLIVHDLNMALRFADKVLILSQGRHVAFGTPKAVLNQQNLQQYFHVDSEYVYTADQQPSLVVKRSMRREAV